MLTGVVYANAAAQLMKMIYVSSAHQANNTADIDSASSLYHDYVSLHFYQVMEASTSCSFAAKVQETGNVSLLTEASKLQARDADFGKDLQFSGGMDGHFPSGSIIPSRAKNNGVSRFSRREKSDKIFQNPSTLKGINIQRPAFKDTPARTSKKDQRSQPGNFIFELKREFRVSSKLTESFFGKPSHQGSIAYIDQDRSTATLQVQEGHDTPTGDDGTTSLEDRVQDGMSTHDGGNDNRAGSAGQAQAQVHPKDKFAEEPAGRTGTIGEHTMSGINAASSYSGKLQSPVTLVVTKSNSDNDENGWHKDNNSDCEYQADDKAATLLVTKTNSDNDENSDCEYQVDDKAATLLVTKTNSDNDENSDCKYQVNDDEATTATIAVQGHHTQEGQLNSTSEPYPCARLNSGERGGKTYQVKDCQHLGRTFIDALKQADNTKVTAYDSKGESGIKANFKTVPSWAKSERSPGACSTEKNFKHQCVVRGEDTRSGSSAFPRCSRIQRNSTRTGRPWQAGALHERTLQQSREAARESWSGKLHLVACSTIYLSSSTTLERRKGRGRRRTKTGAPARTTPAVRQEKKYQQGASSSALRFVRGRVTRYCVSVRPNHSGFTAWLRRQGQRYPGAVWTKELRLEPVATVSSGHGP